ncbi:MAG: ATP-grasp domain-containing protein [Deltaproteobacteria bacterium]|nr:ATP-grasp domain-containing protein [Deltaproteobacteria bacterium]
MKVMIAGIGGASLGTELMKCLALPGDYELFGCDISPTAYGLYETVFRQTFRIDRDDYLNSVMAACRKSGSSLLIPGGEQPMVLLGAGQEQLRRNDIHLAANDAGVIRTFSDKSKTFDILTSLGIAVPRTALVESRADWERVGMPCIVKPSTGSGGSTMVFFATSIDEAMIYEAYIRRSGSIPIAQEYIPDDEGEFTVGVLSWPDGEIAGSIALRRVLDAKLSVLMRGRGGVISSGYTQGYIGDFAGIRAQAEAISAAVGSRGPINIQGRVRNGLFLPFEINPRFSASTYLRAMAGFNEVDLFLRYLESGQKGRVGPIREGWYLRSLTEKFVSREQVAQ